MPTDCDGIIEADAALKCLETKIQEAWLAIRPDRLKTAKAFRSAVGGNEITVGIAGNSGGDGFACNPSLGNITMKWWALEVLWITAYTIHNLGGRLARAALDGQRELEIGKSTKLTRARDLLAHASKIIEGRASIPWSKRLPHPADRTTESKQATRIFLNALAWIEHHEIKHIIEGHGAVSDEQSRLDETDCDKHATDWLLSGRSAPGSVYEGITVALFYLSLAEILNGYAHFDHPHAAKRILDVLPKSAERYAFWLALTIDVLHQSGGHPTPAASTTPTLTREFLQAEFDYLARWASRQQQATKCDLPHDPTETATPACR